MTTPWEPAPHWAHAYLGKPWRSGAEGPTEFDCYGLVRAVYRDVRGVDLPIIDLAAGGPLAIRHGMETERDAGHWTAIERPIDTDVVLMSFANRPHHVGLWANIDGGRIVHALEGAGVVAPDLLGLSMSGWRILSMYRRAV